MSAENTCIRLLADQKQINRCREILELREQQFDSLARVLALAGNAARLKILYLLHEEGELCPCDLSDILGMTIPAVSQHLRKLKDADVVQARKEGQTIFYTLKNKHLHIIQPLLQHIDSEQNVFL